MNLHSDILRIIFSFLGEVDRVLSRCVCKRWHNIIPKPGKISKLDFTNTLPIIQWAIESGAKLDQDVCAWLAYNGNLSGLKWARSQGAPWDEFTCANAAEGGHLDVLKWARIQKAPWNEYVFMFTGNLEIFQWAYENDCPFHQEIENCLTFFKQDHILDWCKTQGLLS